MKNNHIMIMFILYFSTITLFHFCVWYHIHTDHVEVMTKLSRTTTCLDLLNEIEDR